MAATSVEGPLSKWTNVMKGWQYRWFVLDDNAGLLSYYTSKENMARGARRGCVRLQGAVIGIDGEDDSTFAIRVDRKTFHFQARDAEERERWVRALEETIQRHTLQRQPNARMWEQTSMVAPTQRNFDTKLTEADSYLQLLIEQIRDLECNVEKVTDLREKKQLAGISNNANALLETIKHTIVLLQIAKNTAQPVNGVYPQRRRDDKVHLPLRRNSEEKFVSAPSEPAQQRAVVQSSVGEVDGEDQEKEESTGRSVEKVMCVAPPLVTESPKQQNLEGTFHEETPVVIPSEKRSSVQVVPPLSYSSSDEEEDFFDAQEEREHTQTSRKSITIPPPVSNMSVQPSVKPASTSAAPASAYDAAYEDDSEEERSLENQKSVFSHVLSQLRIGMDLTRVTLPTFILERRSLLEMYADFFAHPNLFVNIVDHADPKDRMVEVVRWYLSAFHAGRKSAVAKKPYNPILGEIFRCYWKTGSPGGKPVTDGPVPWACNDDLTFIAEQVSHHPPVSAFYAENVTKGIACCAHIWTKSKFLGMSIGVHNIGQGCVMFLKHGEEYLVNFPSGYGRSIFTVPWIELGGNVDITCNKTGYSAAIQFHTKPIIGGKRHQITADIFLPNTKQSFVTITGEWNGVMTAKYPSGQEEPFVDTTTLPIVKKIVKSITEQEEYESRRLWKDVTLALKNKDVNVATDAKAQLEEKQRAEAKERKDTNGTWTPRVFKEVGEHWVYTNSLQKRLARQHRR
ncbi:oxysterol-binding protein-related protein 9-like isoform X2 [Ornithodoros turicata]|uniref:oxysterol-binding protein-related protein 9-like isoform X2 n=1 Tax=Ornithodoros turicata TaxID=34597 RepID=UPI003138E538